MLHPWAESSVAAAESDLEKALDAVKKAIAADGAEVWVHLGRALSRLEMARGELRDSRRIEGMAAKGEGA